MPEVSCGGEDGVVRPELLSCASLVCITYDLDRIERLALFVFLLVDLAVSERL